MWHTCFRLAVRWGLPLIFLLRLVDDVGDGGVACDVEAGAEHVEDAVDAGDGGETLKRQNPSKNLRGHDTKSKRKTASQAQARVRRRVVLGPR